MQKLAINGGTPIRTAEWPPNLLGASLIGEEELNELKDVVAIQSPFRHYGIGTPEKVATFEKKLCEYYGRRFSLAVSSGSAALICALAALGLGPGDEVILSAFTWFSDYNAIVSLGIVPVFADIDETLAIDPAAFAAKITPCTKAVIVVNFQGGAARMNEICRIAQENNIKIIEDCAQAMGGRYGDKLLGTFGDITILSFQLHKVLTSGEGGALIMDNEEYFVRAVRYHDLGFVRPYFAEQLTDTSLADDKYNFAGLQFRMTELQGAFLVAQFRKIDRILSSCRSHHEKIRDYFSENKHFTIRYTEGDCGMAVFMLFDSADEAETFEKCLKAEGIQVGAASACANLLNEYPIKSRQMVHSALPPFGAGCAGEHVRFNPEDCPNTDKILSRYRAVSIGATYREEDIDDIIRAIEKVCKNIYD
ncbi:MAG: aminotransferase class I/II-fold pyridoxal phosphate-dependent enzyme [Clostridiales bacterium]|nr:aminotransferase class I/II-fold pyridoxal phosphate-dependent enzyme [Clostridiales bacterium]